MSKIPGTEGLQPGPYAYDNGEFSNDDNDGGNDALWKNHAPTAFNSKREYQKLAIAIRVLQIT